MRIARMFWYAHWQKFLVCAGADYFGMRIREHFSMSKRRSLRYAQAQAILVWAGAGHFGMRKRKSFWYAQPHAILVCAGVGYFGMRRRRSFSYSNEA